MKTIMILDGSYPHAMALAAEIKHDFPKRVRIIGVGASSSDLLLRSRYCDELCLVPDPKAPDYSEELLAIINKHMPDLVIPVGFLSVKALTVIAPMINKESQFLVSSKKSVEIALDKTKTLALASSLGIRVPEDFTGIVRAALDSDNLNDLESLPYPVFLKISEEIGGNLTGVAMNSTELRQKFKAMVAEGYGDNILVQEYIDADSNTHGCALLYSKGKPVLEFQHVETRSVPRLGGSATRIHIDDDAEVRSSSHALLSALDWEGCALVEFKKDNEGKMVLMEINPKFWASYELASRNGYRFGSAIVELTTDLVPAVRPDQKSKGTMVFPLREFIFTVKHIRTESLIESVSSMFIPPAQWNIRWDEIHYYLGVYASRLKLRLSSIIGRGA